MAYVAPSALRPEARRLNVLLPVIGLGLLCAVAGIAVAMGELPAMFLAVTAVASALVMLDFRLGVVLLILLMPIEAGTFFPHAMLGITGLNPLNLLLGATLLSFMLRAAREGSLGSFVPRQVWLYLVPLVLGGLIGLRHVGEIPGHAAELLAINFTGPGGYARDMIVKPIQMVLFALLLGAAVARSREPLWFLAPMLLSIWIMGLLVIGFVLDSGQSLGEIAHGARTFLSPLGLHANDLGRMYMVAYALLLFTFAHTRDPFLQGVLLATMLLVVAALLFTFSRGAFVGFILVNVIYLLWNRSMLTWIAGVLGLMLIAWKLPGAVMDRVTLGFDSNLNAVSAGRIDEIWLPLLPELLRNLPFGNGHGSILWSDAMKGGSILIVSHPHNAYLQALLDIGLVGFALVAAFFLHVWRKLRLLRNDPALPPEMRGFFQGAAAGLLAFLAVAFFGSSLLPEPEQTFLWLAIGAMYGIAARRPTPGRAR
jgi:hypothetical protein